MRRTISLLFLFTLACAHRGAVVQSLNKQLLASTSATRTLEQWCSDHHMAADPKIVAVRMNVAPKAPGAEQLQRLDVRDASEVMYRRVQLRCGTHVFSEADNWYVPARLTPEMNVALTTTDTPFGKVVSPLHPYRRTIASTMLRSRSQLFQHRAVLYTEDHRPFSEVVETYQSGVLAFEH